jgi:hypothetical protein
MMDNPVVSTYKALRRAAEVLVEPIDFDKLAADGVLRARGKWFEVLDVSRLPECARVKIKAVRAPNLVKFRKPAAALSKLLRRGY